jgi:hypothetical protein
MKTFYALVLGLALLPACSKKKCCTENTHSDHEYVEERISGVENALDLK